MASLGRFCFQNRVLAENALDDSMRLQNRVILLASLSLLVLTLFAANWVFSTPVDENHKLRSEAVRDSVKPLAQDVKSSYPSARVNALSSLSHSEELRRLMEISRGVENESSHLEELIPALISIHDSLVDSPHAAEAINEVLQIINEPGTCYVAKLLAAFLLGGIPDEKCQDALKHLEHSSNWRVAFFAIKARSMRNVNTEEATMSKDEALRMFFHGRPDIAGFNLKAYEGFWKYALLEISELGVDVQFARRQFPPDGMSHPDAFGFYYPGCFSAITDQQSLSRLASLLKECPPNNIQSVLRNISIDGCSLRGLADLQSTLMAIAFDSSYNGVTRCECIDVLSRGAQETFPNLFLKEANASFADPAVAERLILRMNTNSLRQLSVESLDKYLQRIEFASNADIHLGNFMTFMSANSDKVFADEILYRYAAQSYSRRIALAAVDAIGLAASNQPSLARRVQALSVVVKSSSDIDLIVHAAESFLCIAPRVTDRNVVDPQAALFIKSLEQLNKDTIDSESVNRIRRNIDSLSALK